MYLPAADAEGHTDGEAEAVHVIAPKDSRLIAFLLGHDAKVVEAEAQADTAAAEYVHAATQLDTKIGFGDVEVRSVQSDATDQHLAEATDAARRTSAHATHERVDGQLERVDVLVERLVVPAHLANDRKRIADVASHIEVPALRKFLPFLIAGGFGRQPVVTA